jgi:flagellar hook-associated protein FlgK
MTFSVSELTMLITVATGCIVQIIVAIKSGAKVDGIQRTTDALVVKAEEIHTQTNSNLSVVKSELKEARQEISLLKDSINEKKVDDARQSKK